MDAILQVLDPVALQHKHTAQTLPARGNTVPRPEHLSAYYCIAPSSRLRLQVLGVLEYDMRTARFFIAQCHYTATSIASSQHAHSPISDNAQLPSPSLITRASFASFEQLTADRCS